ncbi:MAG: hypothetical protein E2O29_01860 [Deltaproteobacteria bacterium]|nr:MAG: hypothetical protein E2O29_01860 [Deltaproteobacteria bacterium]
MFDYINFKIKCPNCKYNIDGFQSKDGPCDLEKLEYWQVKRFYSSCSRCSTWIEYVLPKEAQRKMPISEYKRTISKIGDEDEQS